MTLLGNNLHIQAHNLWVRVHQVGFWWLILFIFGVSAGFKVAGYQYASKFDESIKLGSVIHKTIVYDIKLRP